MKVESVFGNIKVFKRKRFVERPELESYTEPRSIKRS